ncbi:MAG: glycosyltransferase family 4 protein [Conexibacteraceae bacterium]|nr:glycosyltransferase family 4 protein [Conexibacteraceae bacterium]
MITQLVPGTAPVDGVHRAALALTSGVAAAGVGSVVLVLRHGSARAQWESVAQVREAMPFLACTARRPAAIARSLRFAARWPNDSCVVVAHREDLVNAGALIGGCHRIPLVWHAHNAPPDWMRWGDPVRLFGTRGVRKVIVASRFMERVWRRRVPERVPVEVVEYPIDCDFFEMPSAVARVEARRRLAVGDGELLVAYSGRIEEAKGVHVLAAAGARLAGRRPVHVLLQGPASAGVAPDQAAAYRARCEAMFGDTPHTWLAPDADVRPLLAAADIAVVPSVWAEPSGLTVSEALATGTPLVASDTGGIPEQMPSSQFARLVRPGDAAALASVLEDVGAAAPGEADRRALREHVVATRGLSQAAGRYLGALTV